jgi:methylated-DNA-[protein]-cysteine S-methyltransferase
VRVWATDSGIRRIDFRSDPEMPPPGERLASGAPPAHLGAALAELREYLDGTRREFDLPLDMSAATPFQRKVYERLLKIPYGQVATYGEVARDIGAEMGTARAVGQAVGANPIAIVVPCHRVVAADGRLVGFGGGIGRKAALLRREGIDVDGSRPSSRVHPEIIRLPL